MLLILFSHSDVAEGNGQCENADCLELCDEDWLEDDADYGDSSTSNSASASINLSDQSAVNFDTKFHFIGLFYKREFRTQHLGDPSITKNIIGETQSEIVTQIWDTALPFISREVIVELIEGDTTVQFAKSEKPEVQDASRFIFFKHEKGKKLISLNEVTSRMLANWRGKQVPVHVFKYSAAVATNTVFELVKKKLIKPNERTDRSGAPTTEELFEWIVQLKEIHPHYSAVTSSWEKWANYVLCHPEEERTKLANEAPPDEYIHLFRSVPLSEGIQLRETRYGLLVAQNILERHTGNVTRLCSLMDEAFTSFSAVRDAAHAMRNEMVSSRELLNAMDISLPPIESEFSRTLSNRIRNIEDVDHQ